MKRFYLIYGKVFFDKYLKNKFKERIELNILDYRIKIDNKDIEFKKVLVII